MKKRILFSIILLLCIPVAAFASGFTSDVAGINEAAKSVLMLEVFQGDTLIGTGSGFVVGNNRTLVTNHHVIEGGTMIIGYSDDGYSYMLNKVFAADAEKDLAILGFMSPTDLKPLTLNTGEILRAEPVVAIGSPQGMLNTVSMGNVSGFVTIDNVDCIQFTAPISNGSSGGALFNDRGEVIGVTTSILNPSNSIVQNLNFAVNASTVIDLLNTVNEADAVSLGDYNKGILPGPTPEPTPEPTPTPTKAPSIIHDLDIHQNADGTVIIRWQDDSTNESCRYYIGIRNIFSGAQQIRIATLAPNTERYFEYSIKLNIYLGDRVKFVVDSSYDRVEQLLISNIKKDNCHLYVCTPENDLLSNYVELSTGSTGTAVKKLQNKLKEYGYLSGAADGIYGKQTAKAVNAFSQKINLGSSDVATPEIQAYLFNGNPDQMRKVYYHSAK